MTKLSCLIVDDEPFALDLVEDYVKKTPFLELKGKCLSAQEVLQKLADDKIDLLFLDIQMPDMNGLELSKTLSASTKVIFTTAFKDYAFEGFKVDAVDYLLKPFNYQEFLKASNKALKLVSNGEDKNKDSEVNRFIFVKSEYRQLKINLNDVFYFEGLKDYVKIWLKSQPKPVLTLMSLKALEAELPVDKFMRVHRSFIIALDKIDFVERGRVKINNQFITIAEQYKTRFHDFITTRLIN